MGEDGKKIATAGVDAWGMSNYWWTPDIPIHTLGKAQVGAPLVCETPDSEVFSYTAKTVISVRSLRSTNISTSCGCLPCQGMIK